MLYGKKDQGKGHTNEYKVRKIRTPELIYSKQDI